MVFGIIFSNNSEWKALISGSVAVFAPSCAEEAWRFSAARGIDVTCLYKGDCRTQSMPRVAGEGNA